MGIKIHSFPETQCAMPLDSSETADESKYQGDAVGCLHRFAGQGMHMDMAR